MKEVYPFQIIGAKYIVDNKKVLIADEMGLFKTSQSIFAKSKLEESLGKVSTLVVCPYSVKAHWKDEINEWYYKGKDARIVDLSCENYQDSIKEAKDADFVLIHYDVLSRDGTNKEKERIRGLQNIGFRYVLFDEVHNAKNPEAIRSKNAKLLADNAEYLALLSGTPIPNEVIDLYMLMSMLEPKKYKIDFQNPRNNLNSFYSLYQRDPHLVKTLLHQRMLRREAKDYIDSKLPKAEFFDVDVELKGKHADVYHEIYNNENMAMYTKLKQILKASLDPALVDPKHISNVSLRNNLTRIDSEKYKRLDRIVEEEARKGGKVLVFSSHFKNGVTEKLRQRYSHYNAEVIDGDVDSTEREEIRKRFQFEDSNVLLATIGTMSEGVDLTAANAVVFLDKGYTTRAFDQAVRRSLRVGEIKKDKVNIYSLINRNDIPTIDEGIERLLSDKKRWINFILKGYDLSKEELKELFDTRIYKAKPIREALMSPRKIIFQHYLVKRNKGGESIKRSIENNKEISERIPDIYLMDWENTLQGNTSTVYKKIINGLEKKADLENMIDLACGPFVLSRTLNRPVVNVDLDPYMLKKGLETAPKGNVAFQAFLHNLPVQSNSFDFALCSLAYQMLAVERKGGDGKPLREREAFLKETNRILKDKGYFLLNLPCSMIRPNEVDKFYNGLNQIGFDVVNGLSGYIESNKRGGDFKIFNALLQKVGEPSSENLARDTFEFAADRVNENTGEQKKQSDGKLLIKRAFYGKFMVSDGNGNKADLEDRISQFVKTKK